MIKRTVFTTITPLPPYITRETVVETLHDHKEMIELNPLVTKHDRCKPAPFCPPDEFHCTWYELTDRIHYLPGGIISGNVSYKACFYDLPRGLQTHVYAPLGLDIRDKWSICGNMPGEPREPVELGLKDAPREGLYLREDIDMRSQIWSTSFVKKTLKKAHGVLVERLVHKADLLKEQAAAAAAAEHSPPLQQLQQQQQQQDLLARSPQASSDTSTIYSRYSAGQHSPTASEFGGSHRDSRIRPQPLSFGSAQDGNALRLSGLTESQQLHIKAAEMPGSPPLSSPLPAGYAVDPKTGRISMQLQHPPEIRVNNLVEQNAARDSQNLQYAISTNPQRQHVHELE